MSCPSSESPPNPTPPTTPPHPPSSSSSFSAKVARRKRKLLSQGGQKWFKGSPRKSRLPNHPVLHAEKAPQESLPSSLVLFTFTDASERRLSVYDTLTLIDEGRDEEKRLKKRREESTGWVVGGPTAEEPLRLPQPTFRELGSYVVREVGALPNAYIRWMEMPEEEEEVVEYDVDEEDTAWLECLNRRGRTRVSVGVLELLMDRLEKESYLRMQSEGGGAVIDDDAVCCICMDGECQNSNAILFCDMCNLAVHQECYGVPYIPEGQWLCRRCLQSPSRAVDCVLCPNKGGAFKQTDDGRWAHVVCAIWIPEVCFANTVFLEPVDSVGNIPPARWRLCCFICKYKGRGACIQCHKSNCYTAFHVTCAQYAGLCMKMDTVRVGGPHGTLTVRKTAYCDNHAPPDFIRSRDGDSPSVRQKLKACRKMLAEKRSALPMVSIPTIPPDRLSLISASANVPRNSPFLKHLLSYWKLKRIQRNGVPLLRRLQAASSHPPVSSQHPHIHAEAAEYKFVMRLRQDLERARLLCELIRKREKMKRELVVVTEEWWDLRHRPLAKLLHSILDEVAARDAAGIFEEPVDEAEVPDYRSVVLNPMDISTMRANVNAFRYASVHALSLDFQLMIANCLLYNSKDTVFYRAALRLQQQGALIFRQAEALEERARYEPHTQLHAEAPTPAPPTPSAKRTVAASSSSCDTSPRKPRGRPPCRRSRRLPPSTSPPLKPTPPASPSKLHNNNNNNELMNGGVLRNGPPAPIVDAFSKYRDTNSSDEEEERVGGGDSSHSSSEGEDEEEEEEDEDEEDEDEEDGSSSASSLSSGEEEELEPLQLVWATQGSVGVWSPALIVDPNMRGELVQNGVAIPAPPSAVLGRRPAAKKDAFLVLFFDNQRTWEWKGREEVEPLGVDAGVDKARLEESSPGEKRRVRRAYEKAILHRTRVRAGLSAVQTTP